MAAPRSPDATGDTRRRIIDTALELFATRGYAGTSMRDISMQLSVTKAALYYHFPSKEDFFSTPSPSPLSKGWANSARWPQSCPNASC